MMYRGKVSEGKMKGHDQEMLMMMMMKQDLSCLNSYRYDQGGSSSFSGLYADDLLNSWNVLNQNMNRDGQNFDSISSGHMFNGQSFDNLVDMDLSQRFYGMNLDEKVGFNDHFCNGTGNSVPGFCDYQGSQALCDSMGPYCGSKNLSTMYNKEQVDYDNLFSSNINIRPSSNEGLRRYCGIDDGVGVDRSFFSSSLHGSQLMRLNSECECSVVKRRAKDVPTSLVNQPFSPLANSRGYDSYSCEDNSFIIQGDGLSYVPEQRGLKGHKKKSRNEIIMERFRDKKPTRDRLMDYGESCEVRGASRNGIQENVYLAAKDQLGCRYLQRIFDEGSSEDVQIIFNGIIHKIFELMVDPFGNYLVQKLLTVCSDEQRMQFVLMVTKDPGELVQASRTTHGTRVVQKLIETMKTRQEIFLVVRALQPGFLELVMDANGNHVIQRCLQCLSRDYNKFIFDGATRHCVDIATHRYGCCVLNKCVTYSAGKRRDKLLAEICYNGLQLAQDPFGNYVIQFIIELKIPSVASMLLSQFEGHYVYLSKQKFSSHVVEKFLKRVEESRSRIISELVAEPHFDQLLQDPFANYVIQSALGVTKGPVRAMLIQAVRPHTLLLRTSPYCKKILSRRLLKK